MSASRSSSAPDSDEEKPRRKSGVRASAPNAACRRRHNRYDVHRPVRLVGDDGHAVSGHCTNLSMGGLLVVTPHTFVAGKNLRVWLDLPDTGELFLAATVRWSDATSAGLQHELLGAQDTFVLTEFLASLSSRS